MVYVCVFLAIVAIVATLIAIAAARSASHKNAQGGGNDSTSYLNEDVSSGEAEQSGSSEQSYNDDSSSGETEDAQPTAVEISFILPVEEGYVIKDYTAASVVYNQTLGVYTGHLALDIGGAENATVFAAFDGEVESITTGYLEGTTVTIDHGNGLKTVYNSIEADDDLSIGDKIVKGDQLGIISTNNRQEYKDGAHLHFEVWENGRKISPFKYLTIDEK